MMHTVGRELVALWKAKATVANGSPFPADQDLKYTVVDISWGVITGTSPGTIRSQMGALLLTDETKAQNNKEKPVEFQHVTKSEEYEALDSLLDTTNVSQAEVVARSDADTQAGRGYSSHPHSLFLVQIALALLAAVQASAQPYNSQRDRNCYESA